MKPNKSCAVVVRDAAGALNVLAFRHPTAGCQLVKGTVEDGESAAAAAVRELKEEAGVVATVAADLGLWPSRHESQVWLLHLCEPSVDPPDSWTPWCEDDGCHGLEFFWQSQSSNDLQAWHPVHARALAFVRGLLSGRARRAAEKSTSV